MYQIKDQKMLKISQRYNCMHCCKKWLVVLTTEWVPWLHTSWGDSGYERFILVLEANCINNLNPNHTLQLTTLKHLRESLQLHFKLMMAFVVTLLQMFSGYYYICKIMRLLWNALWYKKLWHFTDVQWLLYLQDHALVVECSLIQEAMTLSQMFSGYWLQDRGCKIFWEASL